MNNNNGILEARIKQITEGNYKEMDKEFSLDDFDPKPVEKTTKQEETEPTENKKPEKSTTNKKKPAERNDPSDMEEYRNRFLISRPFDKRTSFPLNRVTLDILKDILHDTNSRVSLSSFVENILLDHLNNYRSLINDATAKNIRKHTIPNM